MDAEERRRIQDLMVRFADGDRDAFQALFDALWPALFAFTRKMLPNLADAEDAAQEALVKVFSRIPDFDRRRDGLAWALGIAGYEVMSVRTKRRRRRESAPVERAAGEAAHDVETCTVTRELGRNLRALMGELSEMDRAALAPLLAGETGPTGDRARKRRLRAIERLRAAWRRVYG